VRYERIYFRLFLFSASFHTVFEVPSSGLGHFFTAEFMSELVEVIGGAVLASANVTSVVALP